MEQVFADVTSGPLAHMPSGVFAANAAWLSIAAMAHNLLRAAGALANPDSFALYGNFKFPVTIALGVVMTEPVGALIALKLTHTPFSVSSVLGLLALMGVSVETAVILVSYINKLRLENKDIRTATREASLLRLRRS